MNRTVRTGLLVLGFAALVVPAAYSRTQRTASMHGSSVVQPHALVDGTQPPVTPKKPMMLDGTQPPVTPKKPVALLDGTQPPVTPKKPVTALDT
jgi:hypothetical protein